MNIPYNFPTGHPKINFGKIGILLVNLGTPEGYDKKNMKIYLREFLSDKRVIEKSRIIWWPLLNFIILRTRPKKSGLLYKSIWNEQQNESPLKTFTRGQSEKLAKKFSEKLGKNIIINWAMRYGQPSIASRLEKLQRQGCEKILVVPLYPQYCAATTATVCDSVFRTLLKMRWQPTLRVAAPYFADENYIAALGESIKKHLATLDFAPEKIIASYHGIPKNYFDKGDPYHCHCQKTSRLLKQYMNWGDDFLLTTFQSRFGPDEWLQPYTDKQIEKLAKAGTKNLAVITPGFASDCLETLEEIAGEAAEIFIENGGKNFSHIPCLNDSAPSINLLEKISLRELSGWL